MNVLVTGGAGYIGSAVIQQLLADGNRVTVLDSLLHGGAGLLGIWSHPSFSFVRGDVRDRDAVRQALSGNQAVVHLAAIVGDPACAARDPAAAQEVNVEGSKTLIEEARRADVARFAFASTCSNYGKMKDPSGYVDENSELTPVSLYARTKVAVEKLLIDGGTTGGAIDGTGGGMAATCMRLATIFGVSARMRFDLTVNEFTAEMVMNRKLLIFGEQFWRPYIHVRDAARAVAAVLAAPIETVRGEVFNVGSTDQNHQKRQLVDMIRPYARDAIVERVPQPDDPRDYRVSFEKIKAGLGFNTQRTVSDGIREVAELLRGGVITDPADPRFRN